MELHLKAQLTAEDYAEGQFLHGLKRSYIIYACVMVVLACVIIVLLGDPATGFVWICVPIGLALALLVGLKTVPSAIVRRTKKIFAQQKSLQLPRELTITDTHLYAKSERGEAKLPWEDFHKWKANEKIVLVYPSDVILHMFPRRWFASDADFQSFKDFLAQKIGPLGKPKKRT